MKRKTFQRHILGIQGNMHVHLERKENNQYFTLSFDVGSPVSLTSDLKSSKDRVFIQVRGGNNSWINFWDFSCSSRHLFPLAIYLIYELAKGTSALTQVIPSPMEAGNLGIDESLFIQEGHNQKEGPSWWLRPQNTWLPPAKPLLERGHSQLIVEALGRGKPSSITTLGCQWSKHPRVSCDRAW